MKANSIIGTEPVMVEDTLAAITFHVKDAGSITLDLAKVHPANMKHAAMHGFIQRISDAAAISRDPSTGKAASPAEKLEAMTALVHHYESGTPDWTRVKTAGPKGGYLFEALVKMYGHQKSPADIRAWLDTLSDKEQAALREDDEVAPIIAEIKKAKQGDAPRPDTKTLLAGLKAAA